MGRFTRGPAPAGREVANFSTSGTTISVRSALNRTARPQARPTAVADLVDLLGETRARVVHALRRQPATVADLAAGVGLSEVAIRRHLQTLTSEGLVTATTVRRVGPGRPSAHYRLTDKARRLFPDNSAELANELMGYLEQQHGRPELLRFLRWRVGRHAGRYAAALGDAQGVRERAESLAELLSADGFDSSVEPVTAPDGATTLQLTQGHCAIAEVAAEHPELCAFEASLFRDLLGAKLSRRETIATGATACVCHITPDQSPSQPPTAR